MQRAVRVADELTPLRGQAREEILQRRGFAKSRFAVELDAAPPVVDEGIGLDVPVLTPELEGVLPYQIRDTVGNVVKRVGAILHGTPVPTAQPATALTKTLKPDSRKSTVGRDARVNRVSRPISQDVGVEGEKPLPIAGVAKPEFVHDRGSGGPNP